MTREERAKQFMPFDALKGLREALEKKEQESLREDKRELSEEDCQKISFLLNKIAKGVVVKVEYFSFGRYLKKQGEIQKIDKVKEFMEIDQEKIYFDDVYSILVI